MSAVPADEEQLKENIIAEIRELFIQLATNEEELKERLMSMPPEEVVDRIRFDCFVEYGDDEDRLVYAPLPQEKDFDPRDYILAFDDEGEGAPYFDKLIPIRLYIEEAIRRWRTMLNTLGDEQNLGVNIDSGRTPYVGKLIPASIEALVETRDQLAILLHETLEEKKEADAAWTVDAEARQAVEKFRQQHGDQELADLIRKST